jgi:cytochrome c5
MSRMVSRSPRADSETNASSSGLAAGDEHETSGADNMRSPPAGNQPGDQPMRHTLPSFIRQAHTKNPTEARAKTPAQIAATVALATGLCLSLNANAQAPDAHALYTDNCTKCHGSEVYTRADRKVTSKDALKTQVRMCEQNLGLKWFDEEVDSVATLLNKGYYKFGD